MAKDGVLKKVVNTVKEKKEAHDKKKAHKKEIIAEGFAKDVIYGIWQIWSRMDSIFNKRAKVVANGNSLEEKKKTFSYALLNTMTTNVRNSNFCKQEFTNKDTVGLDTWWAHAFSKCAKFAKFENFKTADQYLAGTEFKEMIAAIYLENDEAINKLSSVACIKKYKGSLEKLKEILRSPAKNGLLNDGKGCRDKFKKHFIAWIEKNLKAME